MNLLDLMNRGVDPEAKALDRLEIILEQYESENLTSQEEALERAQTFCFSHWSGYQAGMEALALRIEAKEGPGSQRAWRWRAEGEDPGMIIRAIRHHRSEAERAKAGEGDTRSAVIARYGSAEAARWPTALEQIFIGAAAHLAGEDDDPYAPLAGWRVAWHELPPSLYQAVVGACPLPKTVADARDETLAWDGRRRELELVLDNAPAEAMLPTACAARHRIVEDLWRKVLPVDGIADLTARLQYWATYGGDDGLGYGVLLSDLDRLIAENRLGMGIAPSGGRGDAARRLKAAYPNWSLARIGAELGISRQAVHKHLKKSKP